MQRWVVPVYPQAVDRGWSLRQGLSWGLAATTGMALLLAVLMCGLARWVPFLLIDDFMLVDSQPEAWTRVYPWGFGVTGLLGALVGWILLETMQRSSGMAGSLCTGYALLMAIAVIGVKHLWYALYGVQTSEGFIAGWQWVSPEYLLWYSYGSWVGLGALLLWRRLMEREAE
ncbi:MAG: hypothetical protein HJJLKODD_00954 [Phycisphaerae bacterium]|nr:hypothetical protein [Phycisphaerae bacterium]